MLIGVCILIICGLIFYNNKNVNNKVFDFVVICSIVIIGQKYLKVAILLTLLLFILKLKVPNLKEGFELEEKDDEDTIEDNDNDNDDDDNNEDEDEDDDDAKDIKKSNKDVEEETDNTGTIYETDCKKRCKKSGREEKECEKICNYMCPNPIKYNEDLKQLNKFKKVMEQLD